MTIVGNLEGLKEEGKKEIIGCSGRGMLLPFFGTNYISEKLHLPSNRYMKDGNSLLEALDILHSLFIVHCEYDNTRCMYLVSF